MEDEILKIARDLPEWFTKEAIAQIEKDMKTMKVLIEKSENEVSGFLIYEIKGKVCYVNWLGVEKNKQCEGIGPRLIQKLIDICKKENLEAIETDTLAETEDYIPYESTRAFYHKNGFEDVEIIKKGYPEGSDKLILRKQII